ncbi:hypothetical protein FS749_002506 [Ceratobasidium sp. UAMH 11750]|nr:hypothetical protein FS749_002506 [Ceratobasidium sp. UAMH 11750]
MAVSEYLTYQLFNTLFFLWFTAENFFVFTLSLGLRDPISSDPVPYPRYGFGIGRRTLLTPAPWAFAILFLVHILFAGTAAFVQWTERGKDIVIRGLKWCVRSAWRSRICALIWVYPTLALGPTGDGPR